MLPRDDGILNVIRVLAQPLEIIACRASYKQVGKHYDEGSPHSSDVSCDITTPNFQRTFVKSVPVMTASPLGSVLLSPVDESGQSHH